MQLNDERFIPNATPATVFKALNDAEVLKRCIPYCEKLEKHSDEEMSAQVKLKIGPMNATFSGKVRLSDINPPHGYTISGEGAGGSAGFAKGAAKVNLAEKDGGTLLTYAVTAEVGGKLAQLGARLIDGTAKKLAGNFFDNFTAEMAPPEDVAPTEAIAKPAKADKTLLIGGVVTAAVILTILMITLS